MRCLNEVPRSFAAPRCSRVFDDDNIRAVLLDEVLNDREQFTRPVSTRSSKTPINKKVVTFEHDEPKSACGRIKGEDSSLPSR